jgi:transcriptional regulator with XRE-family HTH domain
MNDEHATQLGEYIRHLRTQRAMSLRELAETAGIDSGGLTRVEHGRIPRPRPDTLYALAHALDVPLADLFAQAGYAVPRELPSVEPYLRTKYNCLHDDEVLAITHIVERFAELHGGCASTAPDTLRNSEST